MGQQITWSMNDKQFESAMEYYEFDSMEELRGQIRDTLDKLFNQKVVE